ncbi:hypothetical protein Pryu01_03133 [Paraliobacillus ryukyuensis]|uniref:YqaI-like protein n=1 Tax=Paraliobacillus ryukyuensis TaxID=200904 RepID=A0A366DLN6_9BACI|nr:hypothetical protein [Paraliobacillus ryukyuensis]RBO90990.1 YqaI-like protein [Paraliobacillus ryukyuensis]
MVMLEHPSITRTLRTGYPYPVDEGYEEFDLFGDLVTINDEVFETEDGDIVLEVNMERYLSENLGIERRQ